MPERYSAGTARICRRRPNGYQFVTGYIDPYPSGICTQVSYCLYLANYYYPGSGYSYVIGTCPTTTTTTSTTTTTTTTTSTTTTTTTTTTSTTTTTTTTTSTTTTEPPIKYNCMISGMTIACVTDPMGPYDTLEDCEAVCF